MRVGFTGTQWGITLLQGVTLRAELVEHFAAVPGNEFHHGDCMGADAMAHDIARELGYAVHVHPPDNDSKRAFVRNATHTEEPAPYLVRNQHIVDATEMLLACPGEKQEKLRSGTWATIRYARRLNRPVVIVYPDGTRG